MFSYEINLRKISNPNLKIKAVASVVIDGIMSVDGFKVINGSKGLFVSVPNHKGSIMEDGVKVDKYFDDVRFLGEEGNAIAQEIKNSILNAYNSGGGSTPDRAKAAAAHSKASKPAPTPDTSSEDTAQDSSPKKAPDRTRKPIWNFS